MRASLLVGGIFAVLGGACSNDVRATASCHDAGSSTDCYNCCHANGATGQSWTGSGSCECLGPNSGELPPSSMCASAPIAATAPDSVTAVGESLDSTCGAAVGAAAWKMADAGAACASPLDCSPTCCPCASASVHALSTWCNQGTCATAEETCCMVLGTTLKACGK